MRAHAWAEYFANGGRSRGGAAAREGGGTDGWGYPVSDRVRGEGSARRRMGRVQAERAWAEQPGRPRSADVGRARAWVGLRAKIQAAYCAKLFFLFPFYAILD